MIRMDGTKVRTGALFFLALLGSGCGGGGFNASSNPQMPADGGTTNLASGVCSVAQVAGGAQITCQDGSTALVAKGTNGTNGSNGTNGTNGLNGVNGSPFSVKDVNGNSLSTLRFITADQNYNWFYNTSSGNTIGYANSTSGGIRSVGILYFSGTNCTGTVYAPAETKLSFHNEIVRSQAVSVSYSYYKMTGYADGSAVYRSYCDYPLSATTHNTGAMSASGLATLQATSLAGSDLTAVSGPIRLSP